jgi:hypothetical protein
VVLAVNASTSARILAALLAGAAIAGTHPSARASAPRDLRTVIDESGKALGVGTLTATQGWTYHGIGMEAGLPRSITVWVDRGAGAEAIDVVSPPVSRSSGYDGHEAWVQDNKGVVWLQDAGTNRSQAMNRLYRDVDALWKPDRGGATVEVVGVRTDGNLRYNIVRVAPAGSSVPFEYWFDTGTHLPMRVVETAGAITTTTLYADYRSLGGIRFAFSETSRSSLNNATTETLDRFRVNPDGLAEHVRKPQSRIDDFGIANGTETRVPFDLIDNRIYLNVMLNGVGPYRFLFDTSRGNVIDPAVAYAVAATPAGAVQIAGVGPATEQVAFARVASVGIAAAQLRDQTFVVMPLREGLGIAASAEFDGIIGSDVLARFVTTVDYGKGLLTLRASAAPAAKSTLPLTFAGTIPSMPCAIEGIATACTVDTGSPDAIDLYSPFVASHPVVVPANATASGVNGFGVSGPTLGRLGRLASLRLGDADVPDTVAGFSTATQGTFATPNGGADVGGEIWRHFTVTLDYPKQTISLSPKRSFGQPETHDRSGIFAIRQNRNIIVAGVRPGTPAANAGLIKGDIIQAVDGVAWPALTLANVRESLERPAGTALTLRVMSTLARAPKDVTLTLRDYV